MPLIDDNGDGVGTRRREQGQDGAQASRTYLEAERPGAAPTDEELLKLLQRKSLLEAELEELKIRSAFLAAEEYAKEFERIITDTPVSRARSEKGRRRDTRYVLCAECYVLGAVLSARCGAMCRCGARCCAQPQST